MRMVRQAVRLHLNDSGKPNSFMSTAINGAARISESDPYTVLFDGGQEITNGTEQKDGSRYDIPSLDIEHYSNKIYEDHFYGFRDVLGEAIGVIKDTVGNRITLGGIRFSKKNPTSLLARDMLLEGLVEFSIGTIGFTDDDGLRKDHRLIDISIVGLGNNDFTDSSNRLAELAAVNGYDLGKYNLNRSNKMLFFIYNTNSFAVKVKVKNEAGVEEEKEVPAGSKAEVPSEEAQKEGQKQIDEAEAPEGGEGGEGAGGEGSGSGEGGNGEGGEGGENQNAAPVTRQEFGQLATAINKLTEGLNIPRQPKPGSHEQNRNIGSGGETIEAKVNKMSPGQRLYSQIMSERNGNKNSDLYRAINDHNKNQIAKKKGLDLAIDGLAENAMDDSAGSLGGLIPPYELLDRIEHCETNYDRFLQVFGFEDAGLSYGWNVGIGDIDFQPVGYCDPSTQDGFEVGLENRTQERLATHSVLCNKVSRFSPVNVLNIVAKRYQQAYKRALTAFALAEMQVAVDKRVTGWDRATGTDVAADPNGSLEYPETGQDSQIRKAVQLFTDLSDCVQGGVYVMNAQTAAKLILDFNLTGQGDTQSSGGGAGGGTTQVNNYNALGVALGGTVVIVPNNMLPTLGTSSTVTVVRTTPGGGNVTIDHAIFYTSAENWHGVTNGALQFDVDSFGSYEVAVQKNVTGGGGGTVTVVETRSAKQRGETVLFGEMYRGGGIFDFREIGGIKAEFAPES